MTFKKLDDLHKYMNTVNNFQTGELIYLTEEERTVIYNGKEFVDIPKEAAIKGDGLNINLYDLNKSIIAQLPALTTEDEQAPARALITEFYRTCGSIRYMLLCKDISYYTIFTPETIEKAEYPSMGYAVLDCLSAVGQFICADLTEDGGAVEIWVRTPEDENLCMYLFGCEQLFVTFRR